MGAAHAFFETRRDCANSPFELRGEQRFPTAFNPQLGAGKVLLRRTTPALTACAACPLFTRTHPV